MLDRRRCFGHVDLRGQPAEKVHEVITTAIQTRLHAEGFSYLKGAHCIGFANELWADLQVAFPPVEFTSRQTGQYVPRKISFCEGQCGYTSQPTLAAYIRDFDAAAVESLVQQEAAAKPEAVKPEAVSAA